MQNKRLKLLALSAAILCTVCCKEQTASLGDAAPEIVAYDLQGKQAKLSDWQGTRLLTFWSETCGVCVAELKELEGIAAAYPNKVQLIAINVDGEKADTQAVVNKRQITQPVIKDQMKITAERYQLVGTPTSFVVDPNGKVIYKFEGLLPEEELQRLFTPTKIN